MNKYELLAPAKNLECGKYAIDAGADAVYIGAESFGAREKAGNSVNDIETLVKYAHRYNAKVYVTVNTILYDREIPLAHSLIQKLYHIQADGIIIQDPGLLEMDLPPIKIIASTQMHNISAEKINFFSELGVKRFILPRETSLKEIKEIREKTNTELECFIHGALCVSYSGRCYLSFGIGGRSANRGACAQPCRKLYSLYDTEGKLIRANKYFLSLKDLCLADRLEELIDAGITSFKIEGRLKDTDYVTNTVAYYRQKLDEILEKRGLKKSSSGFTEMNFTPDINKTFNRGYTEFFLDGNRNTRTNLTGSIDTPKMMGEYVCRVKEVKGRKIFYNDKQIPKLHSGDGICYFDRYGTLRGTQVNKVFDKCFEVNETKQIAEGTRIFRNSDFEFGKILKNASVKRFIKTEFILRDAEGGILFEVTDEDGIKAEFLFTDIKDKANDEEKEKENITRQLKKSGNSYFRCQNVVFSLAEIPFFPMSLLNEIRRECYSLLAGKRRDSYQTEEGEIQQTESPYIREDLPYQENIINSYSKEFYTFHGVKSMEEGPEGGCDMVGKQVMSTKYCIRNQMGMCNEDKTQNTPIYLADENKNILKCTFDCKRCGMNIYLNKRGTDSKGQKK
ncbi:MAG: U32 family peptidase [Armatimonadetes bacterium]|nr:U32 family peptidase [Candidatus Hippobium faecium]